ncbi:basic proline-rich protein-like [Peromyscus californicus insignis]|uniref:basic proline-rich protein-like n=1 Tax=Peromyscus californicus insignis TaxID=564181 RepID=UPI0022A756DF|nr:basic proline-rich protein-like [Peromyscus californicus insignis]
MGKRGSLYRDEPAVGWTYPSQELNQPAALSQPGPLAETLRKQNGEHDVKTAATNPGTEHVFSGPSPRPPPLAPPFSPPSAVTSPPLRHATPPPSSNSSSVSWTRPPPRATPPLACPAPSVSRICPPPPTCPTPWPALPSPRCPACASGPSRRSPTPGPSRRSRQPPASPPQPHHALDLSHPPPPWGTGARRLSCRLSGQERPALPRSTGPALTRENRGRGPRICPAPDRLRPADRQPGCCYHWVTPHPPKTQTPPPGSASLLWAQRRRAL